MVPAGSRTAVAVTPGPLIMTPFDHSLSTDKLFNTFCVHKSSSHKQIEAEPIALPIDATLHDKLFAVTFVKLFNTTTSLELRVVDQ